MARVFITGSSDGLGLMAARLLIEQGHEVVLHGRNEGRSRDALATAPGARGVVSGDLATIAGARTVADEVNKLGRFDAVIHNAGVGYREGRVETEPGVPTVFAVNVLAPYILTALIERPNRLVYVSSGMHRGVRPRMDDLLWTKLEKYLHTGRPPIARRPRRPKSVFRSRVTRLRLAAPTCAIMPTDQQGPR